MTDQVGQGLQHGADYMCVTIRVSADLEKEDEVVVEVPADSDHLEAAARGETTHRRRRGAATAHGHGNASLICATVGWSAPRTTNIMTLGSLADKQPRGLPSTGAADVARFLSIPSTDV